MHANKLCCYMENKEMTPILHKLITQSSLPPGRRNSFRLPTTPDSAPADSSAGTTKIQVSSRKGLKAHVITGVKTNIITAVVIAGRDANDSPMNKPLVEATAANFDVKEVPADKAYLSKDNLDLHTMGGTAYIPFKSSAAARRARPGLERTFHYYQFRRDDFLKHYHVRANAESTFSMVKAVSASASQERTRP